MHNTKRHIVFEKIIAHSNNGKLNNISGAIRLNKKTLIVGNTNCGSQTLLEILSGRYTGKYTGELIYDSIVETQFYMRENTALIGRKDILFPNLTVKENITLFEELYNAKCDYNLIHLLKLEDLLKRNPVIHKEKDIHKPNNSKFQESSSEKILSPLDRKKLNILIGLINDPEILFILEPTIDFDFMETDQLIKCLNELSQVRTIIVTSKNPTISFTKSFDRVIIMYEGDIIFSGKHYQITPYFTNGRYDENDVTNPVEYFLTKVSKNEDINNPHPSPNTIEGCVNLSQLKEVYEQNFSQINNLHKYPPPHIIPRKIHHVGKFYEFFLMSFAYAKMEMRRPFRLFLSLIVTLISSMFISTLYSGRSNSTDVVRNMFSLSRFMFLHAFCKPILLNYYTNSSFVRKFYEFNAYSILRIEPNLYAKMFNGIIYCIVDSCIFTFSSLIFSKVFISYKQNFVLFFLISLIAVIGCLTSLSYTLIFKPHNMRMFMLFLATAPTIVDVLVLYFETTIVFPWNIVQYILPSYYFKRFLVETMFLSISLEEVFDWTTKKFICIGMNLGSLTMQIMWLFFFFLLKIRQIKKTKS
ncbi:hypothetical protein EDEG_01097 [Edhazardia aedis USNM 41457]|uniref:ABC transporter domain-containing protein n=1 Tax=Edhazardia aedis (strain USNM 41457) TaxID=1003232 RepID=J9DAE7_EDHAE|nr:hypothetical protein EDEG_01097 [Edhazardia aedis USNM 41457]|eukprot:EJW04711.1 hypothetical protein EDEG_01097 [Edhazardia aedis USNM 41457]